MNYSSRLPASCSGVRGEAESVGWFSLYVLQLIIFTFMINNIQICK
jgi:hypothetical protein